MVRKFRTALLAAAVLAAGSMMAPAQAGPDYSGSYTRDRIEIEDLMARYVFALDYNDLDSYIATFTPDGEIEFASGSHKGHDNILKAVRSYKQRIGEFYKKADGSPATLRHLVLQTSIRVEGDEAWVRSQWVEIADDGPDGTPKMGTFGIYDDTLQRVDGRWLFSKRRILNEFLKGRESGPGNPVAEMDKLADAARR